MRYSDDCEYSIEERYCALMRLIHEMSICKNIGDMGTVRENVDKLCDLSYILRRGDCNGENTRDEYIAAVNKCWKEIIE